MSLYSIYIYINVERKTVNFEINIIHPKSLGSSKSPPRIDSVSLMPAN